MLLFKSERDGVLIIKYIDETRLVMMPDGTQILTKNSESGSGTITLLTKEGFTQSESFFILLRLEQGQL